MQKSYPGAQLETASVMVICKLKMKEKMRNELPGGQTTLVVVILY